MKKYTTAQLVFILAPFVFSFAFGLDIYIPIVPQMVAIFDTSPALIHLTLSLFLFVTGVGQLLLGPLSDQFGRRIIFCLSSICFTLGSISCALSGHISFLIMARFLSSLGACGMLVTSFALVRDLFSSDQSAKMYSFLNGAIGISPTLAPIIGGYLAIYLGWKSIFFFLGGIGLWSLFISKQFIHETHPIEKRIKLDKVVFKRYWQIFSHRQFLVYSLIAGAADSVFFCFFSTSPFIIIDLLGIPTQQFGYYFSIFGLVIALGGIISGKLVEKIGINRTIGVGGGLMLLGGFSMLIWYYAVSLTLWGFLIPMVIACSGAMFLVGASAAGALEPFGSIAGTAAAAFGAFELGSSAIVGAILMIFPTQSTVPYGICIVIMAILSLSLWWKYDLIDHYVTSKLN